MFSAPAEEAAAADQREPVLAHVSSGFLAADFSVSDTTLFMGKEIF